MGEKKKGAVRVWVVVDAESGDPFFRTVRQRRDSAALAYTEGMGGIGFESDRDNGFVRMKRATLTLEQPKVKKPTSRKGHQ